MIAADTSSLVAFLENAAGRDVSLIDEALEAKHLLLPPVVLTEMLSIPELPRPTAELLLQIPLLEITDGYWERAGKSRAKLMARKLKARIADSLIAQSCLDAGVALITRDRDFRHFAESLGLKILE